MTQHTQPALPVDTAKEVLNLLSINNDGLLSDQKRFWEQVALALGVPLGEDMIANARSVINDSSEWDDDYLLEDGTALSDEAYLELLAILNRLTNYGERSHEPAARDIELPTYEDDEVDDSTSWAAGQYGVGDFLRPDADTLLRWIYNKDLIVNPQWQRNFVWPLKKQRRFIESVLIGLPIPSLLLFEEPDTNKKYVIDGRQRLETLATFCANPEEREALGFLGRRFRTFSKNEALWRSGEVLHDAASKFFDKLPDIHKRKLRSAPFTVFMFRGLQPRDLYRVFQRYNTGAEKLRAAEIRNAVYQDTKLHRLLWRLAGESPDRVPYHDEDERYFAETLKGIMRTKTARYGVYDFIGRVLAFTYLDNGKTVAVATNDFMDLWEDRDLDSIRDRLLRAFQATVDWYQYPLTTPEFDGRFHAFLGTVQMATSHHALDLIEKGDITEGEVATVVRTQWARFAEDTLEMKQNSSNFWQRQRDWMTKIEAGAN